MQKELSRSWTAWSKNKTSSTFNEFLDRFRELIVGGFLSGKGLSIEYERLFEFSTEGVSQTATPDWTVLDEGGAVLSIIEVDNFHGKESFERFHRGELDDAQSSVLPPAEYEAKRLRRSMFGKCRRYKSLANSLDKPFIVACVVTFAASWSLSPEHVVGVCTDAKTGLFGRYPEMSGLLHCGDLDGYRMRFRPNPSALRKIHMPVGWL
jgi:hypothetical protein